MGSQKIIKIRDDGKSGEKETRNTANTKYSYKMIDTDPMI